MTSDLKTPCCNTTFFPVYESVGSAPLDREVVEEYLCDGEGCYSSWEPNGRASQYNSN